MLIIAVKYSVVLHLLQINKNDNKIFAIAKKTT